MRRYFRGARGIVHRKVSSNVCVCERKRESGVSFAAREMTMNEVFRNVGVCWCLMRYVAADRGSLVARGMPFVT